MSAPPQARPNAAQHADRDRRIFQLKIAGATEREIAAEVDLSQSRVHQIVVEQIGARVGPPAEEYVALREAELADLWTKAYRIAITADDPADRLKAIEQARRVNESRRKLRGADAPESIAITHEANMQLSAEVVTSAVLGVLDGLRLTGQRREYALQLAQHQMAVLDNPDAAGAAPPVPDDLPPEPYKDPAGRYVVVDGVMYERPERNRPKELLPGPSAGRSRASRPVPPAGSPEDSADAVTAVLDALRDFEEQYGGLDDEASA